MHKIKAIFENENINNHIKEMNGSFNMITSQLLPLVMEANSQIIYQDLQENLVLTENSSVDDVKSIFEGIDEEIRSDTIELMESITNLYSDVRLTNEEKDSILAEAVDICFESATTSQLGINPKPSYLQRKFSNVSSYLGDKKKQLMGSKLAGKITDVTNSYKSAKGNNNNSTLAGLKAGTNTIRNYTTNAGTNMMNTSFSQLGKNASKNITGAYNSAKSRFQPLKPMAKQPVTP